MPLKGRVQCIDRCIHQIVAALNAGGIPTAMSCCGHQEIAGRVDLEDGRVLVILNKEDVDNNKKLSDELWSGASWQDRGGPK